MSSHRDTVTALPPRGPLVAVISSDRSHAARVAEQLAGQSAYQPQSDTLKVADVDQILLPQLQKAGHIRLVLTSVDLAGEPVRIRLLKTLEQLTDDSLVILTAVEADRLGASLTGRCTTIIQLPTAEQPHPWDELGPLAEAGATSTGKTRDAFTVLATSPLTVGPVRERVDTLTQAVDTLTKQAAVKKLGGRAAVLEAIIHRLERETARQLRQAAGTGTISDQHPARETIALRAGHARQALTYHPPTRPLIAALLP